MLVTAGIHGNEPLSTSVTMSYMCYLLSQYGKDIELTKLIDETTIYYVPVVSPDSYPYSRHVDSVDPNRNFPTLKHPAAAAGTSTTDSVVAPQTHVEPLLERVSADWN